MRADSGQQFLTATIGQRFYLRAPARRAARRSRPSSASASNMVGEDRDDGLPELERAARDGMGLRRVEHACSAQASVQYKPRNDAVINVGYRYREGLLEQWEASARLAAVAELAGVRAPGLFAARTGQSIDRFAGFEYGGCCWRLRLLGRQLRVQPHRRKRHIGAAAAGTQGPFVGRNQRRHFPAAGHSWILPRPCRPPTLTRT